MDKGYWIKSKPQYGTLQWQDKAIAHRVIASRTAPQAVLRVLQLRYPIEPLKVFLVKPQPDSNKYIAILKQILGDDLYLYESEQALIDAVNADLDSCYMGTQFYVAGTEVFMWDMLKLLKPYGVQDENVVKEQSGSLVRSVYCVHCKTINKDVHQNIHECIGCKRKLLVGDHFSRNLGAYNGFMVDAEEPGVLPDIQEVYP